MTKAPCSNYGDTTDNSISSRLQGGKISYIEAIIVVSISIALAFVIYAPHLLDPSVPLEGTILAMLFL